jgi:hypothetical protein
MDYIFTLSNAIAVKMILIALLHIQLTGLFVRLNTLNNNGLWISLEPFDLKNDLAYVFV